MSADLDDPFPVPRPEPVPTAKKKPGPAKGSPEAKDAARRAVATRRARGGWGKDSAKSKTVAGSAEVQEVRQALADAVSKAGGLMMPVVPIPGAYCLKTSEDFADAVARLAAKNPKLLKSLSSSSSAMDYIVIGSWLAGLGVAVGVQFQRMPYNGAAADVFGIKEIVEELGFETEDADDAEPEPADRGGVSPASILGASTGTPADVMVPG